MHTSQLQGYHEATLIAKLSGKMARSEATVGRIASQRERRIARWAFLQALYMSVVSFKEGPTVKSQVRSRPRDI